ncbi:MAG: GDSL-type esterase/lipase family protein [Actinomycetota bacterium]
MKDLLIVGDSLAGGLPYLSFSSLLKGMLHDWRITSDAAGGDTLAGIGTRLERLLGERAPDAVVVQAGSNDILLPALAARGGLCRKLVKRIEACGSIPTTGLEDFRELYSRTLECAASVVGHVLVVTIACIGERMESDLNRRAAQFNEIIREEAASHGACVADVGKAFRKVLVPFEAQSGFLLDSVMCTLTDTFHCLTPRAADRLSGRRGLVLTMDGVHLNRCGARLYAETVAAALESAAYMTFNEAAL